MFAGCCRAVRGRPRRFGWGQRTAREANGRSVGGNGWSVGANRGAVGTIGWAGAATEVPLVSTALSWRPTECRWAGTEGSRAPTREPGGLGRAWPVGLWSWPLRFLVAPFIGCRRLPQARRGRQGFWFENVAGGGAQSSANKYSKSVFDRLRAKPSSPRTSAMVWALFCWSSQIFSSTVPGEMRR